MSVLLSCLTCILPAQTPIEQADDLLRKKKYSDAFSVVSAYLKQFPDNDTAGAIQAECLLFMKKPEEAYQMVSRIIQRSPRYNRAYYVRGLMMYLSGNVEEAKNDLNMAARNLNDTMLAGRVFNVRSGLHYETRNFQGCISDAVRSLQYLPDDVDALNNLGLCLGETAKFDSAQVCFMMAYKKDSLNLMTLNNIGFNFVKMDRFEDATFWLDKALKIDPKDPFALNNRGYAKYKQGDISAALSDVDKSISVLSDNPFAFRNRALIYIAKAEYRKACADLDKAIRQGFREKYGEDVDQLRKKYCQ